MVYRHIGLGKLSKSLQKQFSMSTLTTFIIWQRPAEDPTESPSESSSRQYEESPWLPEQAAWLPEQAPWLPEQAAWLPEHAPWLPEHAPWILLSGDAEASKPTLWLLLSNSSQLKENKTYIYTIKWLDLRATSYDIQLKMVAYISCRALLCRII